MDNYIQKYLKYKQKYQLLKGGFLDTGRNRFIY